MPNLIGTWSCNFGSQARTVRITQQNIYANAPQLVEQDTIAGQPPFREVLYTNPGGAPGTWVYYTTETFGLYPFAVLHKSNEGYARNALGSPITFSVEQALPKLAGFQQVITVAPGAFTRVWRMQATAGGPWKVLRKDACTAQ